MSPPTLKIGHSPDPDDAFMFCALARGAVRIRDYAIVHVLEDIESLNLRALRGDLEVTAISAHAYLSLVDRYWVLSTGASMGEGYGPVLVSRTPRSIDELVGKRVAIPGEKTTAALLTWIYLRDFEPVVRPFDKIFEAVDSGDAEAGVLIHEGQLTYASQGYAKIEDFGKRWQEETELPLPLGLDVVRSDLGMDLAREVNAALRASIDWAYQNEEEALDYAVQFGRGLEREMARRFVKMYVSDLTRDMGRRGVRALETLFQRGVEAGVISEAPELTLVS
ncbi:MAG: menaquinone biosynthesis family protein [Vicinamibacteria bacterium]